MTNARDGSWHVVLGVLVTLCLAALVTNLVTSEIDPRNAWGVGYGIAAAAFLAAVFAYSLRRRGMGAVTRRKLGRAASWLQFHVVGGVIFGLLVVMHSGFRLPRGALTWSLWLLSLWLVGSGLLGVALQRWLPRVLASLETEVLYDRIPELCDALVERGHRLASEAKGPVRSLAENELVPHLTGPRRRWRSLLAARDQGSVRRQIDYLRPLVTEAERIQLEELEELYGARHDIDAHMTVQWALRRWLFFHVPLSLVLVVLVIVHVGAVLSY